MKPEPIIGFRTAASEAVKAYEDQLESIKAIKDTAKTILSSTSIVFALMSSLNLGELNSPNKSCFFYVIGLLTLILFALLVLFCVQVLLPKELSYPLKSEWHVYDETYMGEDEKEVYKKQTNAYLVCIEKNSSVIEKMVSKTTVAGYFMILVIFGLLVIRLI